MVHNQCINRYVDATLGDWGLHERHKASKYNSFSDIRGGEVVLQNIFDRPWDSYFKK